MNRRPIIFIVIVAVVFLAVALYFTPQITPVELIMDAVKIDDDGNELGTVQIVMIGSKLDYLFQPSRIDVYIHPFDGITAIDPVDNLQGRIETFPSRDFLYAYYSCLPDSSGYLDGVSLGFSPDFTKWIFRDNSNHVSYVASTDGTCTAKELVDYFNGLT